MKKQIMQERHTNREKYFNEQSITTKKYVIPFLSESKILDENTSVLEIGCGEGGNLVPFVEAGCKRIVGVDLSGKKIENAIVFYDNLKISSKVLKLESSNIFSVVLKYPFFTPLYNSIKLVNLFFVAVPYVVECS